MPVKLRRNPGILQSRLIALGARSIESKVDKYGRTIWSGILPCNSCGKERKVSSHAVGQKTYNGKCLSCSSKENVKLMNPPGRIWPHGKNHHLYKNGFINDSGYKVISLYSNHPLRGMADVRGRAREHRIIMAKYIGRPLENWEVIHHVNGDRSDNRIENLDLLKIPEHTLITRMEQEIKILRKEIRRLNECLLKFQKSKVVNL